MIVTEYYMTRTDGVKLVRTYSDANKMMLQNETGIKYAEAVDVENSGYTYTETDEPVGGESDSDAATEADYQAALRDMGVDV